MAWAIHREWGREAVKVEEELENVIRTIAKYELVWLLAPRGKKKLDAESRFLNCKNITIIEAPVDDIWMRDIAPTFAIQSVGAMQNIVAIDWNFNAWGASQSRPLRNGDLLAKHTKDVFGVRRLQADFIGEGGAILSDGQGTLYTTRSCLLNPNRNPVQQGGKREDTIAKNMRKFGINKVIWLEGDPCEVGTSGHVDGYVLLAPGGIVLVDACDDPGIETPMWRSHDIEMIRNYRNPSGQKLVVAPIRSPRQDFCNGWTDSFAATYLNAYIANGAVIVACFGDRQRDNEARKKLSQAFPHHRIEMVRIDHIANGGGGIHCLTQSVPDIRAKENYYEQMQALRK